MSNYILVINPGSTSTKIGVFENDTLLYTNGMHYSQARAFWSLTLHGVDMSELKRLIIEVCNNCRPAHQPTAMPKRKRWLTA